MSHGSGADDIPEPNLTPLLDLVMQLVMFFMIIANFVSEQLNQNIQLPEATTAVPIDREKDDIVVLNITDNGYLISAEEDPIDSPNKIKRHLSDLYSFYKDSKGEQRAKQMTIIIRGDRNCTFDHIYRVMKEARGAGFSNVQLRATKPKGNG